MQELPQLSQALDSAMMGVTRLNSGGIILSVNAALPSLLGRGEADIVGKPFASLVHQEHQERFTEFWASLEMQGRAVAELRLDCNGDVVCYAQVALVRASEDSPEIYAIVIDTTLQRVSQQSCMETMLLQRAIINCTNFGMMSTDLDGRVRSLNATAEQWTGFRGDRLHQKALHFVDFLLADELHRRRKSFLDNLGFAPVRDFELLVHGARHGLDDEGEWMLCHRDGSAIPVWLTIKALIDEAGELTGYLMIAADLREHKRMQQRLKETEALFRNAFAAAANGIAILDLNDTLIKVNPAFSNLLQINEIDGFRFAEDLEPESWATLKEWLDGLLEPGAQPVHVEFQFVRRSGGRLWAALSIALLTDDGGQPSYYVLQLQDIGERRRLDGELKLAASVFNNSSEGVYITDQRGVIISVNPSFTRITGWTSEMIVGKHTAFFRSDYQSSEFYQDISRALRDTNFWQGELWSRVKDGKAVLTRLSITRIVNDKGLAERYVAVFNDITELRQKDERLLYQAYHDLLTDLPNRLMLSERLRQEFLRAQRRKQMVALLFLDIDHFKYTNDTLGHDLGDCLLKSVAVRLLGSVRETDMVCRLGGDEFVVMLPEVDELKNVSLVARKITESMSAGFHLQGHDLRVTVSIGISVYPQDGATPTTLLRNADTAMYRAKEQGRNNFQFYTPGLDKQVKERFVLEGSLRRALERNELELYYQPKLDMRTRRVVGMEALLRWKHPELGMVPPTQFIPLAEDTGLISPIGDWALATACRDAKRWRDLGFTDLRVAVNLSARQFRQSDLVQKVQSILLETSLDADGLELELTESMIMHNPQETIVALNKLKQMGIALAVDDFGTGYSSLSYLKRFPIDTLKIDRSFVSDIHTDPDDAAITVTIINLARNLRLSVVAEGVETQQQFDFLQQAGCEYMQGYLFSRPIPASEFEKLLLVHCDKKP